MARLRFGHLARSMAGAFLTLLAVGLLSPGSARAGCVNHRPSMSHFDSLVLAGAMPEAERFEASSAHSKTLPGRAPTCSGPMCSQGPAAPPSSSWTVTDGHDSWACLVALLDRAKTPPMPLPPETIPARPSDRDTSIFHPPRIASV